MHAKLLLKVNIHNDLKNYAFFLINSNVEVEKPSVQAFYINPTFLTQFHNNLFQQNTKPKSIH